MKTNNDELVGVYGVLKEFPLWIIAATLMAMMVILVVGRGFLEGLPYNVAYSSIVGENGFIIVVLIAATVLKREPVCIMSWFSYIEAHISFLVLSLAICLSISIFTLDLRSGQWMDIYHDIVVAPLFMFLTIMLLPVIWKNSRGVEKKVTLCLMLLWISSFGYDITKGSLAQRPWLRSHGVHMQEGGLR